MTEATKGAPMLQQLFLAIGSNRWGVGPSIKEAVAVHRKMGGRRPCVVFMVPMGVTELWVDEMGYAEFFVAPGYDEHKIEAEDWPVVKEIK